MLAIRKMLFKNRKGFTLIELIVVIAILAILVVLAVPRFLDALDNAKLTTHNANLRTLESAAQVYLASNGSPGGTANVVWTASNSYVEVWPEDPFDGGGTYTVTITPAGAVTVSTTVVTP